MALSKNTEAPDFEAKLNSGEDFKLSNVDAKYIVLYFYPKDDTPGCTVQACGLRDNLGEVEKHGAKVFGIGKGNKNSHNKFIQKYNLNFPLIVDEKLEICELFDVLKEKSMFGKKYFGIVRTTYIIDNNLKILDVIENVNPLTHAADVIERIKAS